MSARIPPLGPPYAADLQGFFDRIMPPGIPPLVLFRTLARDPRLFERFRGGSLLDKGQLTLRQREIVIDRVTAQCRSEYEWGGSHRVLCRTCRNRRGDAALIGTRERRRSVLVERGTRDHSRLRRTTCDGLFD